MCVSSWVCCYHFLTLFLGHCSCNSEFQRYRLGLQLQPGCHRPLSLHLSLLHHAVFQTYGVIWSRSDSFWRRSCSWSVFDLTHMKWPFLLSPYCLKHWISRGAPLVFSPSRCTAVISHLFSVSHKALVGRAECSSPATAISQRERVFSLE